MNKRSFCPVLLVFVTLRAKKKKRNDQVVFASAVPTITPLGETRGLEVEHFCCLSAAVAECQPSRFSENILGVVISSLPDWLMDHITPCTLLTGVDFPHRLRIIEKFLTKKHEAENEPTLVTK